MYSAPPRSSTAPVTSGDGSWSAPTTRTPSMTTWATNGDRYKKDEATTIAPIALP